MRLIRARGPRGDDVNDDVLEVQQLVTVVDSARAPSPAVDGVSFTLRRGQTLALLGESGCGKSLTALSMMRLLPDAGVSIRSGRVRLNGVDLLQLAEFEMRQVRGSQMAMIFQEPMTSLNPVLTVGSQIAEVVRRDRGLTGSGVRARVIALLDEVGIADSKRRCNEYPHQLSGGMKQRVMIALALAARPSLLIADEPTTALDVTIQAQVLALLREIQAKTGMAMLLITHDLGVVSEMADRVIVMYAGQIVEESSRDQFFRQPRHPYSQKLFSSLPMEHKRGRPLAVIGGSIPLLEDREVGCRFAPRCDHVWPLCRESAPRWLCRDDDVGVRCHLYSENAPQEAARSITSNPIDNPAHAVSPEIMLEVKDLKVHFPIHSGVFRHVTGYVKAVDGVSLQLRAGRTIALVGESGCGKTTVGKALLQLIKPTSGSVCYLGSELTSLSYKKLCAVRKDLQIIFQDPAGSMNPRMMVSDIIAEGLKEIETAGGRMDRDRRIDALLTQVGLSPEMKHRYPHEFSGGQRQRICIARALAVNPKVLICDEPTSALDVSVQAQILNLLADLQRRLGLSYIFITHNLSVVRYLAHEVAVMYLGRIIEQGEAQRVLDSPKHPYTRALLAAVPKLEPKRTHSHSKLQGEMPSPLKSPAGCHFNPRCPDVMPRCRSHYPEKSQVSADHAVACFLFDHAAL